MALAFVVDPAPLELELDGIEAEDAMVLAADLHMSERGDGSVIHGVYKPTRLPGLHDALGVVARWHLAAQVGCHPNPRRDPPLTHCPPCVLAGH